MLESEYKQVIESLADIKHVIGENLGKYSFYGSGGNCDVMFFPTSVDELYRVYEVTRSLKHFILGNGSDILVSDKGFDGVVINTSGVNNVTIKGEYIIAECGAKLSEVIKCATYNSLNGLEFAVGIPALVGGAVANNAGCYNKCIGDYIHFVKAYSGTYSMQDCMFEYRNSRFSNDLILSVCFKLKSWDYEIIESKLEHYKKMRSKAPKGRSCGSVFKNEDYFAGKVIDDAGLKGYRIGGAKISEKHANYIINVQGTSQNVYDLIKYTKEKVYSQTGITLREEIKYVGDF